jgi:DNA-binding transcriptional regulator YiaG
LFDWSGVDFARHMGTAPETVSRWEQGRVQMSLKLIGFSA